MSFNLLAVGDLNLSNGTGHDNLLNPAIAMLSDGRMVVVFERIFTADVDDDVAVNIVAANGGSTLYAANNPGLIAGTADFESNPAVATIANKALIIYADANGVGHDIVGQIFDGGSNAYGAKFTIAHDTA